MTEAQELEQSALNQMEQKNYAEALVLWEKRLQLGGMGLAPFPLYALCLAEVGRHDEARELCERTAKAISGLEENERRDQLQLLLSRVVVQIGATPRAAQEALPSPEVDELFGGGSKKGG